jgi:hypothetical protein
MFKIMMSSYGNDMSLKSLTGGTAKNSGKKEDAVSFSSAIHDSVKKTITTSVSKNSLGDAP